MDATGLDLSGLERALEEAIKRNAFLRDQFASEPRKFFQSEADLNECLERLEVLNELPGGFEEMPNTQMPRLLLHILNHPNIDIAMASIDKLQSFVRLFEGDEGDMGVPDLVDNEAKLKIIRSLKGMHVFEIITNFLLRCSFKEPEEVSAMHKALSVIEVCLEEDFEVAPLLALNESQLLEWIITVLNETSKNSLPVKLYASEILVLLLGEPKNRFTALSKQLLPSLIGELIFRGKGVATISDEKEYVKNLFACLELMLLEVEAKQYFIQAKGVSMLIDLIKMKSFVSVKALQALSASVNECKPGVTAFLKNGGLGIVFPILLGKGIKSKRVKEQRKIIHYAVLIVYNSVLFYLVSAFPNDLEGQKMSGTKKMEEEESEEKKTSGDIDEDLEKRLMFKFKENWYEKLKVLGDIREDMVASKKEAPKKKKMQDGESESDEEEVAKENQEKRNFMTLFMVDFIFGALMKQEREEFQDKQIRTFGVGLMQKKKITPDNLVATFKNFQEQALEQKSSLEVLQKVQELVKYLS